MSNRASRLFAEPLIQFVLIGACIYGAYGLFGAAEISDADLTVVVDANRLNGFVAQWKARWNRPPTREELDGIVNAYIREEILYRQAVSMGLDKDDTVTRRRMAQRLEFLTSDLARLAEPADGELEKYFIENLAQFTAPGSITFLQLFFNPDQRNEATLDDAKQVLSQFEAAGVPDPETLDAGDRLMLQRYHDATSEVEIGKQFGSGFADAVVELEPGRWHGPILSAYGVHLVYVYERREAPEPDFEEVRPLVLEKWQVMRMKKFNEDFFAALRSRYEIIIEDARLEPGSVLEIDRGAENADPGAGVGL